MVRLMTWRGAHLPKPITRGCRALVIAATLLVGNVRCPVWFRKDAAATYLPLSHQLCCANITSAANPEATQQFLWRVLKDSVQVLSAAPSRLLGSFLSGI